MELLKMLWVTRAAKLETNILVFVPGIKNPKSDITPYTKIVKPTTPVDARIKSRLESDPEQA